MTILDGLQTLVTFLIVLSILVVAHEWGHFIIARLFGIRVDDFSIGFGKRLVRLGRRGDTEYNIRMLPLGGFVKIAGMEADEEPLLVAKEKLTGKERDRPDSDPDSRQMPLIAENTPESAPYTAPDGFNAKPLWQRSLVIFAGPLMSFLLGYVLLCLMGWAVGIPDGEHLTNRVALVQPGGEGHRIGLRAGDIISAINGVPMTSGNLMVDTIHGSLGKPLVLTIQRDGRTLTLRGTPGFGVDQDGHKIVSADVVTPGLALASAGVKPGDVIEGFNGDVLTSLDGVNTALRAKAGKPVVITIRRAQTDIPIKTTIPQNIAQQLPVVNAHYIGGLRFAPATLVKHLSLSDSIKTGNANIVLTFVTLGSLIHQGQIQKSAGGVIMMSQATNLAVKNGLSAVIGLMAQLSISLAIFNLLPIPVLDGGHLLAFFIEWVRRGKKMTEQQQQAFMLTGLAIIGVLFVLIMTNDILRTIHHQVPQ